MLDNTLVIVVVYLPQTKTAFEIAEKATSQLFFHYQIAFSSAPFLFSSVAYYTISETAVRWDIAFRSLL